MSTGDAFDPDYVPADPVAEALDMFARMPVIIGREPDSEIVAVFEGMAAMMAREGVLDGLDWNDARGTIAAMAFDLMERAGFSSWLEHCDVTATSIAGRQHFGDAALVDAWEVELMQRLSRFDRRGLTFVGTGLFPHGHGHRSRVAVHDGADPRTGTRGIPGARQWAGRISSSIGWRRNVFGNGVVGCRDCCRWLRRRNARRQHWRLRGSGTRRRG